MSPKPTSSERMRMMFGLLAGCAANNGVSAIPVKAKAVKNAVMMLDQTVSSVGRLRLLPGSPAANSNLVAPASTAEDDPT